MLTSQTILMTSAVVLVCCLSLSHAAPAHPRSRRHLVNDGETRVSVIFDALTDDQDMEVHSRTKRHAASDRVAHLADTSVDFDPIAAINADDSLTAGQRRQKRSAVLYLHATMQFCKNYPLYCRRIEIDEGDVKLRIRLEDM